MENNQNQKKENFEKKLSELKEIAKKIKQYTEEEKLNGEREAEKNDSE